LIRRTCKLGGRERNACRVLVGKSYSKSVLGSGRIRWILERDFEDEKWIKLAGGRVQWK
jgi:hypothetical protein